MTKYDGPANEMMAMGGAGPYQAKYPSVTTDDIKALRRYLTMREVWNYMNTPKAQEWWAGYCAEMKRLIEARFPAMKDVKA
jgi:hypothetical protein